MSRMRDARRARRVETGDEWTGEASMGLRWRMDVRLSAIDVFNPTEDGTMKGQFRSKAIVAGLAALCAWSGQASAIDGQDAMFNCKVRSRANADGTGTSYWLRVVAQSGKEGTLVYTTDASKATVFTFTRKDTWKHDYHGTTYFMMGAPTGGCVGLAKSVTPTVGTPVQTNWDCAEASHKSVVLDKVNEAAFIMRVGGYQDYWFDGWGGLADGNQIKLNTKPLEGPYNANRLFYAMGCRSAENKAVRPKTGK